MKYAKISAYLYLIFSVLFLVAAIEAFYSQERNPWLLLTFSAVALFMFLFRLKMAKKFNQKSS